MSGDGYVRKYKSGSEKRKQKKVQEEKTQVLSGSLLKYLNTRQTDVDDLNTETPSTETEELTRKTRQIHFFGIVRIVMAFVSDYCTA